MPLERAPKSAPLTRPQFEAALERWLAGGDEPRIGDGRHGQTPWVWIRSDVGELCHLNANTKREGVTEYLRLVTADGSPEWAVVRSRRGTETKVGFGSGRRVLPGFYLYRPLAG